MADDIAGRKEGLPIPRAYEPVGGDAKMIRTEGDMGSLLVGNHVWDADAGVWIKMQQPILDVAGDLTVTMGDVEKLLAEHYWKDKRLDWTSGDLDYLGLCTTHKGSTSAGNLWWIFKFTWVSSNCTRIEGPLNDDWDDRAGLAWG